MRKSLCPYCGANQVPHRLTWFMQSMTTVMMPLHRFLFASPLGYFFHWFTGIIERFLLFVLTTLGLARFTSDRSTLTVSRARVFWEEAERRHISMEMLKVGSKNSDIYRIVVKGRNIIFTGLPDFHSFSDAEWWLDDKAVLKKKLEAQGIPAAKGGSFSQYAAALRVFRALGKPVIVKPRLGSRGRHTTTFIYTEDQLLQAFSIAKQLCHWVLMEEHLFGAVYRGTVIDGKLRGVLAGYPPRVTGDGVRTITELIALKNLSKHEKVKDAVASPLMEQFLARSHRKLADVLPAGLEIDLSEKIGIASGGSSEEVTEITHPETKKILEQAAALVDYPLLGFDFIIPDIAKAPQGQRWGILEANGMPFINLHHDPVIGKPNNVAAHVWDWVERKVASGAR